MLDVKLHPWKMAQQFLELTLNSLQLEASGSCLYIHLANLSFANLVSRIQPIPETELKHI